MNSNERTSGERKPSLNERKKKWTQRFDEAEDWEKWEQVAEEYFASDEWQETAQKLLRKYPYCQDCNTSKSTEVLIMDWTAIGREKLSGLRALCDRCWGKSESCWIGHSGLPERKKEWSTKLLEFPYFSEEWWDRLLQYLKSPEWVETTWRLVAQRKSCEDCGAKSDLYGYFLTYERVGNENFSDLLLLCRSCYDKRQDEEPDPNKRRLRLDTEPVASDIADPPDRIKVTVNRILRNTAVIQELKNLYSDSCQVCGLRLPLGNGEFYSEGHHIRPLGKPHDGPDDSSNVLVLCPNHHAMFDFGILAISPQDGKTLLYLESIPEEHTGELTLKHEIGVENVEYHLERIWRGKHPPTP